MTLDEIWDRIEAWVRDNAPGVYEDLRAGATPGELEDAQSKVGVRFGDDIVRSYLRHNGHRAGLLPTGEWLSIERMLERWELMRSLKDSDNLEYLEADAEYGIREDWWNKKWLPLTDYGSGDFGCADFDPDEGGTIGQIIAYDHELPERRLIARSFKAWLEKLARDLEAGQYVYDATERWLVSVFDL